jgi:hypothetical protein
MLRQGMKVKRLTKKVGQTSPTGTIIELRGECVEVEWEDGHRSVVSRHALVAAAHKA